jgi:hypothetical protein
MRPEIGVVRRLLAFSLVVAPALFLADNLLHPKEYARGNEAKQLESIADAYTRWQLAHALGLIAIVVFVGVVVGLAVLVGARRPRVGLWAGLAALAGLVGLGGAIALDGYTWAILGEVSTKPAAARTAAVALKDVQESEWSLVIYLLPLGFLGGLLTLTWTAVRDRAIPPPAGAVFAAGILMTATETAIISNAYFIAGAAVLLAGGVLVAAHVRRMTDDAFAAGGAAAR